MENAKNLAAFLEVQKAPYYTLENVAYTLQIGKEEMKHRIAFIAKTKKECIQTLKQIQNKVLPEGAFEGIVKMPKANGMIDYTNPVHVCEQFANGYEIDWNCLEGNTGRIVPLPTYAFAKERYWIKMTDKKEENTSCSKIHPLLHKNCSTFRTQKFETTVNHSMCRLVQGEYSMSEIACMEMALAAVRLSTDGVCNELTDVFFRLEGKLMEGTTAVTSLYESEDAVEWEIGYYNEQEEYVIAAQGSARAGKPVQKMNGAWKTARNQQQSAEKTYEYIQDLLNESVITEAGNQDFEIAYVSCYQSMESKSEISALQETWMKAENQNYLSIQLADTYGNIQANIQQMQITLHNMEDVNGRK